MRKAFFFGQFESMFWSSEIMLCFAIAVRFFGVCLLHGSHATGQVRNVFVATFRREFLQCDVEAEEVIFIEATRAATLEDVLRELLGFLRTDKLGILRGANVDEGANRG